MKNMLRFLIITIYAVVIILSLSFFYEAEVKFFSPCGTPKTFEVERLDKGFNYSHIEIEKQSKIVAETWNKAAGHEVLKYEKGGQIKVRFIYDERQRETIRKNIIAEKIRNQEKKLKADKTEITNLKNKYQTDLKTINLEEVNLKNDYAKFNEQIETVNNRGGATEQEAENFNLLRQSLDSREQVLNTKIVNLNSLKDTINNLVNLHNNKVESVNQVVKTYNSFSGTDFEKGIYKSNGTIEIYEFEDNNSLKRVLAHELGHALGLEHTNVTNSVMYYLDEMEGFSITPTDVVELKKACKITN